MLLIVHIYEHLGAPKSNLCAFEVLLFLFAFSNKKLCWKLKQLFNTIYIQTLWPVCSWNDGKNMMVGNSLSFLVTLYDVGHTTLIRQWRKRGSNAESWAFICGENGLWKKAVAFWKSLCGLELVGPLFLLSPTKTLLVVALSGGRGGVHSGTPNLLNDLVLVVLTMREMITAAW